MSKLEGKFADKQGYISLDKFGQIDILSVSV